MTSNTPTEHRAAQAGTGHFMLTLCRLAAPAAIRQPQAPQLKSFTFFTSREREPDGSESLYLHMGYFETLSDAERWAAAVHNRFPDAIATLAPASLLRAPASEAPAPRQVEGRPSLSDTQVLRILETRGVLPGHDDAAPGGDQVALLRPEDTSTRQALKEAVAQGAPVSFAVQLQWSAEPIDLGRVPSLPMFKAHTLYATESRREGRARYFLRVGFFADPVSAKEAAAQVRSSFASAAVVPVAEEEVARAREAGMDTSLIPNLVQQRGDPMLDSDGTSLLPALTNPLNGIPHPAVREAETLEQTLQRLAQRAMWTDPDSLSESGVRHLKVEIQKQTSRRS